MEALGVCSSEPRAEIMGTYERMWNIEGTFFHLCYKIKKNNNEKNIIKRSTTEASQSALHKHKIHPEQVWSNSGSEKRKNSWADPDSGIWPSAFTA